MFFFCILFPVLFSGYSQTYVVSDEFHKAYEHVLNLEKEQALDVIRKNHEKRNLLMTYLESSVYFLEAFLTEEQLLRTKYNRKFENWLQTFKNGNKKSPYYNYCIAHLYLQRGLMELKFSGYVQAGLDIRRASILLEENGEKFPYFYMQYKEQGLLECFLGNVPDQLGWLMGIAGMSGSMHDGERKLKTILEICFSRNEFRFLQLEVLLYYSAVITVLDNDEKKLRMLQTYASRLGSEYSTSPLSIFLKASLSSHLGRNDKALQELNRYQYFDGDIPFSYLYYMKGLMLLQKGDWPVAKNCFFRFLKNFNGIHYIKSAYHKLAWCWLLEGNKEQYELYITMTKSAGSAINDFDKQALTESEREQTPHQQLLFSRLLTDGGYYDKALLVLSEIDSTLLCENHRYCVEFLYRSGRIAHLSGNTERAIHYYKQTIEQGKDDPWYFAANASLMLAMIFENSQNYSSARFYYKLCLEMQFEDYKNSIQQKAKAGLQRISE